MPFLSRARKPKVVRGADFCLAGGMKLHPRSILTGLACLALAACAHHPKPSDGSRKSSYTRMIGRVSLVNEERRFALIETAETPEAGAELQSASLKGQNKATLKATNQGTPPFIIADIVQGEPQAGDTVTQQIKPQPAPVKPGN